MGFGRRKNEESLVLFPPSLTNLSSICLPYVCLVSCVVLAGTVVSVCSFDRDEGMTGIEMKEGRDGLCMG